MSEFQSPAECQFCKCTPENPCRVPGGDECYWLNADRDVCNAPGCAAAYAMKQKIADRKADRLTNQKFNQYQAELRKQRLARREARSRRRKRRAA